MSPDMTEPVRYELRGKTALVTLDDGKANALSPAVIEGVNKAFDQAAAEAKAVVLTGRPSKFCAGFDLRVMMSGPDNAKALVVSGGELFMRIYEHPQPVVMAVTGHALAGGALLAATGDTRIGIPGGFKIGLNEVANGMPVPILAQELARDRLHPTELTASVLQAKIYDPEGAVAAGWLDRLVDPEALEETALEEAKRLSKLPLRAYALTKKSLRGRMIQYVRDTIDDNVEQLTGNLGKR